jgi:DNA-binding PadR family transcriptional regulator
LQAKGLVAARTENAENGRTRKYYRLTKKGIRELSRHRKQWNALSLAMTRLGVKGSQS